MLESFEISKNINEKFNCNYIINNSLTINYNTENIFNVVESNGNKIISYGYVFDVRQPEIRVENTLENLLEKPEFFSENLKFLNGHYVLVFNLDGVWRLITDAACITPIFIDKDKNRITTTKTTGVISLNGFSVLDLQDLSMSRIDSVKTNLTDERIEREILDLVINQYRYFQDKDITLFFKRNRMNKALIAVLYPVLFNNYIKPREEDGITKKVAKWIARDYKMTLLDEESNNSSLYIANTHLMDYSFYMNRETKLNEDEITNYLKVYKLDTDDLKARGKVEYNISDRLRYRNEEQDRFIYDPFNVVAIQELVYSFNDFNTFDPLSRIIKIINPSLDFYDFATGETLMQKFNKLKIQNARYKKEIRNNNKNLEFLSNARVRGIQVSDNLNGTVMPDGISFYPVTQKISKDDVFEVEYKKAGKGMVLVESYFNNPKNAHRIKVNINGEIFNINEFCEGKFINVDSKIGVKMNYERDYDAASWQKAGKITIKEID